MEMLLNSQGESEEVRDNLIGASCSHVLQRRAASRRCQDSERCTPPSLEVPRAGGHSDVVAAVSNLLSYQSDSRVSYDSAAIQIDDMNAAKYEAKKQVAASSITLLARGEVFAD